MAKLIPSLNSCLSRMTSGEKRFARRLEALLEDDYLCWFDIPLGDKRRYPDFYYSASRARYSVFGGERLESLQH